MRYPNKICICSYAYIYISMYMYISNVVYSRIKGLLTISLKEKDRQKCREEVRLRGDRKGAGTEEAWT